MDLVDLELLVAVDEAGSLRRAAYAKGLDVASLSRRIARLEDELGVILFERGRAGMRATIAGESTLSLARKTIASFVKIKVDAASSGRAERGLLRLGTHLSSLGPRLRAILKSWRSQHLNVGLEITEIDDRALLTGLREREVSVIACFCPVLPPEIARLPLWNERLMIALPGAHPLSRADKLRWHDLRDLPLLVRSWCGSSAFHDFQAGLVAFGTEFQPLCAGTMNLLNLVAMGEGGMITIASVAEAQIEGVVLRPIQEPDAVVPFVIAWDSDIEDPVAGSFVAFVRDHLHSMDLTAT